MYIEDLKRDPFLAAVLSFGDALVVIVVGAGSVSIRVDS